MTVTSLSEGVVRIGTRTSQLARWQTAHVAGLIEAARADLRCETVPIVTQGDRQLDRPLPEIGGKGLFTSELEEALRRGEIDIAVHSLKDLPVDDAPGLTIGAVLSRADVRDALVTANGWTLESLPQGAVVGTSSLRRQAQLLAYRPDLTIRTIRGNVDTRIRKVLAGEYDAAVLAGAGLLRLGLENHISQWLTLAVMLPAPGQGALSVQCRVDDERIRSLLSVLNDAAVERATQAERRLLWLLGGGCSAPVAAWAETADDPAMLTLRARVASIDGAQVVNATATGGDVDQLANQVVAELRRQGADGILTGRLAGPLAAKRVVVTRPRRQAAELANLLARQGADVILAPSAQIEASEDLTVLDDALDNVAQYTWVLFTSANAVDIVCGRPAARILRERPPGLRVAAVGPASAAALAEQGIQVDFVPSRHHGDDLAAELPLQAGQRILLPRSALGRPQVREQLAERGALVDDIPVYTTVNVALPEDVLAQLRQGWDAITFTSGSTLRGFVAAVAGEGGIKANLERAVIACIGPATAAVAQELGLVPQVVATDHTAQGLATALAAYVAGGDRVGQEHG